MIRTKHNAFVANNKNGLINSSKPHASAVRINAVRFNGADNWDVA